MIGLGVMIASLCDSDGGKFLRAAVGKTIAKATLGSDELTLTFEDGTGIQILDAGQSCCEDRHMRSDDDVSLMVGSTLIDVDIKEATTAGDDDDHEIQFLDVRTSNGVYTVANHNIHNGFYGGFHVVVRGVK